MKRLKTRLHSFMAAILDISVAAGDGDSSNQPNELDNEDTRPTKPNVYDMLEAQERETLRLKSVSERGADFDSVPDDAFIGNINTLLNISIPTLEMRSRLSKGRRGQKKEKLFVVYIVELKKGNVEWRVGRRFSEFYLLNKFLMKVLGKATMSKLPRLPPKRMKMGVSKFDPKFTLMRREKLEVYLQEIIRSCDSATMLDALDDFLEYSEHMIVASVKALPSSSKTFWSSKIVTMLESILQESNSSLNFRRNSIDSDLHSESLVHGSSDEGYSDTETLEGIEDSSESRETASENCQQDESKSMVTPVQGNVAQSLQLALQGIQQQLQESKDIFANTEKAVFANEGMLERLKRNLRENRIKANNINLEMSRLSQQADERKLGLKKKYSRMVAEKKILHDEVLKLQKQTKSRTDEAARLKQEYEKKYDDYANDRTPNVQEKRTTILDENLKKVKMLRITLEKAQASLEDVSRVSSIVDDMAVSPDTPHQDLMIHARELLQERCTLLSAVK